MRRAKSLQARLTALLKAHQAVASSLDLTQVLAAIVREAASISGAPTVRLFLLDDDAQWLRCRVAAGFPLDTEPELAIPVGTSLSGQVAVTGQPLAVADTREDPRTYYPSHITQYGVVSYLGLPVKAHDQLFGVLVFNTPAPRTYPDDEIAVLSAFATHAALAVQNARLYEARRNEAAVLERRVHERTTQLEEALRVKAEFLAKMSHELRTPLNFILGFADLLRRGAGDPLTPKQAQYVDRIHTGGTLLLDLISAILDLSEAELASRPLHLEELDLPGLMRDVLDLHGIQAEQKRVTLAAAIPTGLRVVAERRTLCQICAQLVGNAIKFTPHGGTVRVTARPLPETSEAADAAAGHPGKSARHGVELCVEDTGIGLAAADLERIFRGFEQVDGSASRQHGGAGIGLALVRKLVELYGGKVWAESAGPGRGARFLVYLPPLISPKPKRVLVVDDEAAIQAGLEIVLRKAGYAVQSVGTGADALAAIDGDPPDLVILDIGLPDLDGRDLLTRLRKQDHTRAIPVLALTGVADIRAEDVLGCGASEFLTKPVSPGVLTDTVRNLLAGQGRAIGPQQFELLP
jgi:signal transduction histidine kinase/CheY-like chemotaxis protein